MSKYYVQSLAKLVLVVALLAGALYAGSKYSNKLPWMATASDSWQAVALDSNVIYFGHLSHQNDQYVTLDNVYVAQTNPNAKTDSSGKQTDPSQPAYLLQKITAAEVFGPESSMQINRDHVLFIQNLASDSQVIKTIQADTSK